MIFILLGKMIHPSFPHLIELVTFVLLCKIKYTFYFPAQRAYVELHFSLDNFMKKCGKRKIYHIIHKFISFLGGVSNTSKEIAYWLFIWMSIWSSINLVNPNQNLTCLVYFTIGGFQFWRMDGWMRNVTSFEDVR